MPTPSQTVGPFFGFAMPFKDDANAVAPGAPDALRVEGQVFDGAGVPVPDAILEAWQGEQFARCATDHEGAFHFLVRKPMGDVGGAPFFNITIFARGLLRHLHTRMYFPDEELANRSDSVLQLVEAERRRTLIAHRDGTTLRIDIRIQGEGETVFFEI